MSFLAPAALALGLLAAPIILLYMLRLRRREQTISSTLLWRELMRDQSANAPWQRLRRNLLLLLQLLILAALVLALARPFVSLPGRVDGSLVVLLDASASMGATDGEAGVTRFEQAVAETERLIGDLDGGDRMTIINVGRSPAVLAAATNDRQLLRDALASAVRENTSADWAAALALAAGSSQGLRDPRFVIISDGNLPGSLPELPGEVTFIPVGRSGDNLSIAALSARSAADGGGGMELLVGVANPGPAAGRALLSLYIDDALFDSRGVDIGPDERVNLTWSLPPGSGNVEARLEPLEGTVDYLPVDNLAWSLPDGGENRRVLLISEGNLFLERLFALLPGYEVVRATGEADASASGDEPYDLTIYDGVPLPNPLPPGNVLVFNPQPSESGAESTNPAIQVTGTFTDTTVTRLADDPLLADVDWGSVNIAEAQTVQGPELTPLVESEGGPLLLAGEVDGHRVAVFTFDLRGSDLPLQIAFPIIMANVTAWLNPGRVFSADSNLQPGASLSLIPDSRAEAIIVQSPDGSIWEQSAGDSTGPLIFDDTEQTGIYTVSYRDDAGEIHPTGNFAVNFFDADESRIQPVETIQIGKAEVTAGAAETVGRRELWPWLLLAALLLLLIEWWLTYRRGTGRPFAPRGTVK